MFLFFFSTNFTGEVSSRKQVRKVVTPPSSANGHVPHDSQDNAVNSSGSSESTGEGQANDGAEIVTRNDASPTPAGQDADSGLDNTAVTEKATVPKERASSAQEKEISSEESLKDVTGSDHSVPHNKVAVEEEQPVVITSSSPVGDIGVPGELPADDVKPLEENSVSTIDGAGATEIDLAQNKIASEVSSSGANNTASSPDQTRAASISSPDLAQQRVVSEGSLSGRNEPSPVVSQTKRGSVAASEHSTAPSDNEVNLSRQNRGSLDMDSTSPTSTEVVQHPQPRKISKEDSASLGGKENLSDQRIAQPLETAKKDSLAEDRKDSVGLPVESTDEFLESESIHGRICTLTASVLIGSLDDPQGERTVTLNGSVYRLPRISSPKPGDKIGFVKGDVTSNPVDNEASEKVATLRGDLLAISGEAASHGQIATASIDVLSCATGEKIATITADVSPDDDPENTSGVISGEVRRASEGGSLGEQIGSLAGKVVALTFDEDTVSITSGDEEYLKLRRESCFI